MTLKPQTTVHKNGKTLPDQWQSPTGSRVYSKCHPAVTAATVSIHCTVEITADDFEK